MPNSPDSPVRRWLESLRKIHPRDARDKYPQSYVDYMQLIADVTALVKAASEVMEFVSFLGASYQRGEKLREALKPFLTTPEES